MGTHGFTVYPRRSVKGGPGKIARLLASSLGRYIPSFLCCFAFSGNVPESELADEGFWVFRVIYVFALDASCNALDYAVRFFFKQCIEVCSEFKISHNR